jgi:hypothetical protein
MADHDNCANTGVDVDTPGLEEPVIDIDTEDAEEAWENELAECVCASVEVQGVEQTARSD